MAKIICIEGLDGAGKSTQVKALKEHYESLGKRVLAVHFPTEKIDDSNKYEDYLYDMKHWWDDFTYDLGQDHKDGYDIIFLDRYFYSTYVYQHDEISHDDGLDDFHNKLYQKNYRYLKLSPVINFLYQIQCDKFPIPDLTIYLNAPYDICIDRVIEKNEIPNNESWYINKRNLYFDILKHCHKLKINVVILNVVVRSYITDKIIDIINSPLDYNTRDMMF